LLNNCLTHLLNQSINSPFEIIIIDNDINESARAVFSKVSIENINKAINLKYFVEPIQNISLARNLAIKISSGNLIAFIDDDEYPKSDWIINLLNEFEIRNADGILGNVIDIYPPNAPDWIRETKRLNPKGWIPGLQIKYAGGTGNLLIKKECFLMREGPFDPSFGKTGGEDAELLNWLISKGCRFYYCDKAITFELVEPSRIKILYQIKRAIQFGSNCSRTIVKKKGFLLGSLSIFIRIVPSSIKSILSAIKMSNSLKSFIFNLFIEYMTQVGKILYYIIPNINIYK